MMEQEKREYRKIREREKEKEREREKEKERERERLAMDRMAMERKRQEGDYRVIFHNEGSGAKYFCCLRLHLIQKCISTVAVEA